MARLTALLNASGDERAVKLEAQLQGARDATAAKLQEFEALKAALLLDLKGRCDKVPLELTVKTKDLISADHRLGAVA